MAMRRIKGPMPRRNQLSDRPIRPSTCARRYARPLAAAGLGLVVLLPLVVIGVVAAKNAPHAAAGALLKGALLSLLLPALLGSAGAAPPLGTGLFRHGAPLLRPRLPRRGRP